METVILEIDRDNPDRDKLQRAAAMLRSGGLVAFPTETVYGLGANALDEKAVAGIYRAKGRPADNPLIVHITDKTQIAGLAIEIPPAVYRLMDAFWPGPLTMIMKKSAAIPDMVTAGLDTVAIRCPSHPIARALISEACIPVAAPSANASGKPSTTSAAHVIQDLSGKVEIIIDSGPSDVGVESTVLDVTVDPPVVLRPGGITPEQISKVLGGVSIDPALAVSAGDNVVPRSPGMKYTHYSPEAEVIIVDGTFNKMSEYINQRCQENLMKGIRTGVLASDQTRHLYKADIVLSAGDRDKPETIAAALFDKLREFDRLDVAVVFAEAFSWEGLGLAIMNRLSKAAGGIIVKV